VTDALLAVPVMVKVLAALALILIVSRLSRHLIVAVLVATVVLGLWCGHDAAAFAAITWQRVFSLDNLMLVVIVLQVIWLSSQMAASGVMDDLVTSVRNRVSQRTSMAVLPAVIGLLPMPGGALFSAPLVDSVDVDGSVPARLKAQTNHWFRHVWEYWWPLYPGVLLAVDITGLDIWQFTLLQLPLSAFAVLTGAWFLLRHIPGDARETESRAEGPTPSFVRLVLPIAVVILCYAVIRTGHGILSGLAGGELPLNKYAPMAVGLLAGMATLQLQRPLGRGEWRKVLVQRRAFVMVAIVVAVRVYGAFIEADLPGGTALVSQMHGELTGWGVPLLPVLMILPFLSGLSTGLSIGFVGASFPIVMALIGEDPSTGTYLSTIVLAYGFGYIGMLISPVHVCLVVTSEHFETHLLRNMLALVRPGTAMLVLVTGAYFLVRAVFP